MKTLYLARHAKSSWKYPKLDDFERPLNKRGRRNAPFMGGILEKLNVSPDLIISSPANRAAMTARTLVSRSRACSPTWRKDWGWIPSTSRGTWRSSRSRSSTRDCRGPSCWSVWLPAILFPEGL